MTRTQWHGVVTGRSGVTAKVIRYCEQSGLIPEVACTDAGYRSFGDEDVHRLRFVRGTRDLGFTVEEIGELLALWQHDGRRSAEENVLALGHIETLREKIAELQSMADTLQALAGRVLRRRQAGLPDPRRPRDRQGRRLVAQTQAVRRDESEGQGNQFVRQSCGAAHVVSIGGEGVPPTSATVCF